jgi:hypothetical protein
MPRDPLADPLPLLERVYAYVAYRIGAGADAEDVTSEVLERALRYRTSFDPARGTPASWLIGIARRCLADAAADCEIASGDPPEEASEPFEDGIGARDELKAALAAIGPRDRELIALRYGAEAGRRGPRHRAECRRRRAPSRARAPAGPAGISRTSPCKKPDAEPVVEVGNRTGGEC